MSLKAVSDPLQIERLREVFAAPFDGADVLKIMRTYRRETPAEARLMDPPAKESAVMMLLFPFEDRWHTVFMLRPDGKSVHSGQLSFPGGRREAGETLQQTALRETWEEVGVTADQIEIIGELNELYIPPSHFIVNPFVGIVKETPVFVPSEYEVVELISFPLESFLKENILLEKEIVLPKYEVNFMVHYFDLNGYTLWGATAMMVQEVRMRFGFTL